MSCDYESQYLFSSLRPLTVCVQVAGPSSVLTVSIKQSQDFSQDRHLLSRLDLFYSSLGNPLRTARMTVQSVQSELRVEGY